MPIAVLFAPATSAAEPLAVLFALSPVLLVSTLAAQPVVSFASSGWDNTPPSLARYCGLQLCVPPGHTQPAGQGEPSQPLSELMLSASL